MENQEPTQAGARPAGRSVLSTALVAGVIASIVFQLLEILLIPLFGGGSPWGPARMIAAMVMGKGVLPPPDTFNLMIVLVALVVDVVLAFLYVAVLGLLIRTWTLGRALLAGVVFGAALYVVNFYGFTALFPWFVMGRNGVTLFTHVVFSVTAVLAYKKFQVRPA
jgi:hypothetical protein